jgi:DNA polymerase I-like protein with 3'-5' exonuclease and polymerase domains
VLISLDSETALIGPSGGPVAPPLACVSVAYVDGSTQLFNARDGLDFVECSLREKNTVFVGQNIAFDFAVFCEARPDLLPLVFGAYASDRIRDTRIREKLIDIAILGLRSGRAPYSLASIAERRLGVTLDKTTWRLGYGRLIDVPLVDWPDGAKRYAIDDAVITLKIYQDQANGSPGYIEESAEEHAILNEPHECRAAWALHLMGCWGTRTDAAHVQELSQRATMAQQQIAQELLHQGLLRPDGTRDLKAIRERVQAAYQGRSPSTSKGQISTDADTLAESGDATLERLAEYGGLEKLLSTYVPLLRRGETTPIHTRWNELVNSGRTSASPNLQNPPRGGAKTLLGQLQTMVRECFVPRAGFVFCSVDYDIAELRALAQFCEDMFHFSHMADALRAGRDPHLDFAAGLLGISYDEALARKKDPEVKNARQMAKVANFGLPGGMGAERLRESAKDYGIALSATQAVELRDKWLRQYPEMTKFFDYVSKLSRGRDPKVYTPRSGRIRGGVGYCDGCNQHFQGPIADGAKRALFEVAYECYVDLGTALYGARPVLFVHDEIIAELPETRAHEAAERMAEVMITAMKKTITNVPVTATPALMSRWYKAAETVRDANQRLVCWVPTPTEDKSRGSVAAA